MSLVIIICRDRSPRVRMSVLERRTTTRDMVEKIAKLRAGKRGGR